MSKERAVHFPINNDGMDDFRTGMALLNCMCAAMSAMQSHNVPIDLDSLENVANQAVAYLEGAFAWADRADAEETARGYAEIKALPTAPAVKARTS